MEGDRVIVIGGGVIGVMSAFMLKYKYPASSVLLLEKRSQVGQECSF